MTATWINDIPALKTKNDLIGHKLLLTDQPPTELMKGLSEILLNDVEAKGREGKVCVTVTKRDIEAMIKITLKGKGYITFEKDKKNGDWANVAEIQ